MRIDPLISVENLSYYKRTTEPIVQNLNLNLQSGTCLALLGPNGTGKTTTLRLLAGLLKPHQGQVLIQGIPLLHQPMKTKALIGFLPDKLPLYPDLTLREFGQVLLTLRQIPKLEQAARLQKWLALLNLEKYQKQVIGTLSRGQKQRVGILQALVHEPPIVLLDEPTQGLDVTQIADFFACLNDYKLKRVIVFSTHSLAEVDFLADQTLQFHEQGIQTHDCCHYEA
jgi:ABC-2 type transport system ATP-binding protein